MKISEFQALLKPVTDLVSSAAVDSALAEELNRRFPPGDETFDAIERACHEAIADGWMCANCNEGGPRWGRVIEPCKETGNLSVDVVDLTDLVGGLHSHPVGEVCMVMPITSQPCSLSKAAATDESTPPLIATTTLLPGSIIIKNQLQGLRVQG